MAFSRQEYWSRSPLPFPEDLLVPGIKLGSPALQTDSCIAGRFSTNWARRDSWKHIRISLFFIQHLIILSLLHGFTKIGGQSLIFLQQKNRVRWSDVTWEFGECAWKSFWLCWFEGWPLLQGEAWRKEENAHPESDSEMRAWVSHGRAGYRMCNVGVK